MKRRWDADSINRKRRSKIANWLRDVNEYFKSPRSVLDHALYYFDQSMIEKEPSLPMLQLRSCACYLVAAKFEGNKDNCPQLEEIVQTTDLAYTAVQLKEEEIEVLCLLGWNLVMPTMDVVSESVVLQMKQRFGVDATKIILNELRTIPVNICETSVHRHVARLIYESCKKCEVPCTPEVLGYTFDSIGIDW